MAQSETLNGSKLFGGAAVLLAAVLAVALVVPALYRAEEAGVRAERGWTGTPAEAREARAAQGGRLARYAWIDQKNGVVALPIERAMELVVQELGQGSGGSGR